MEELREIRQIIGYAFSAFCFLRAILRLIIGDINFVEEILMLMLIAGSIRLAIKSYNNFE